MVGRATEFEQIYLAFAEIPNSLVSPQESIADLNDVRFRRPQRNGGRKKNPELSISSHKRR